jgi:tetratricopeptide repeat protein
LVKREPATVNCGNCGNCERENGHEQNKQRIVAARHRCNIKTRIVCAAALLLAAEVAPAIPASRVPGPVLSADVDRDAKRWIGTWATAAQPFLPKSLQIFQNQTLRLIVHTSIAGTKVRIKISNTYGDGPRLKLRRFSGAGVANPEIAGLAAAFPNLAHNSLAFCLDGFDWDFDSAGKEFRRAIELNPGYATAHHWYAWHLSLLGRYDDAIVEMRKAKNSDPLSLIISSDLAELLMLAHSNDESIAESQKTIEMDPNFAFAHNQLGQAYLQKQMNVEAIAEIEKAVQLSSGSPYMHSESGSRPRRIRKEERSDKAAERSKARFEPH